jgi:hypothetical protein
VEVYAAVPGGTVERSGGGIARWAEDGGGREVEEMEDVVQRMTGFVVR